MSPLLHDFPDWTSAEWRGVFQTLCKPAHEIAVVLSAEGFAAKTNLFEGNDPDHDYWIRCTAQTSDETVAADGAGEEHDSWLISFPHEPETIKESVMRGLQSATLTVAEQPAYGFSPAEFMAVLAIADFCANGSTPSPTKVTGPLAANDLIKIWQAANEPKEFGWCGTARIVAPVILPNPQIAIEQGLASLKGRGWLDGGLDEFRAAPELRAAIRTLGRPRSFAGLQVNHYGDDAVTVEGFAGIRTDDQIWLWEAAESGELTEQANGIGVRVFRVTHAQLVVVLDDFLGPKTPNG
jgi:hypothetical protein